ncbi:AMMECR1 domain-containing protein [Sporomusaceae bacterium BoRhaA]|uniref:AMMECR1 domain-containing protein n=1 Tax=Pelorhabdus rhamnosifermentans TaxID=2772457 RepID=UPI001C05FDEE|nr:AMMECR1 domain-containing protein [Pelorhabdus rhamnosifermentans]MBU2700433.1 AMMECR1 domain-containing protein [Pelorhabdus rhamnosifermentans]
MKFVNNSQYPKLARRSLEYFLKTGEDIELPPDFNDKGIQAAVFVSIKKNGKNRGCIGTIYPKKSNIGLEIIYCAIRAGTQDPRFWAINLEELENLSFSVDVLSIPEKNVKICDLDPNEYGITVYNDKKRGIILPRLEGISTIEKQLKIVKSKAKMYDDETFTINRFTTVRHIEKGTE